MDKSKILDRLTGYYQAKHFVETYAVIGNRQFNLERLWMSCLKVGNLTIYILDIYKQ